MTVKFDFIREAFILAAILLLSLPITGRAQISVSDPHCAYCGVNLNTGEKHDKGCVYYSEAEKSDSLSSLTDTQTKPAAQPPYEIIIKCPQCGEVFKGKSASIFFNKPENHKKNCPLRNNVQIPQVPPTPKQNDK